MGDVTGEWVDLSVEIDCEASNCVPEVIVDGDEFMSASGSVDIDDAGDS